MYIEVIGISKKIKNDTVINNVTLQVKKGETLGFVGRNGCGKTMLLRAISGLILPTKGSISVDNKLLHKELSFPESMGLIIEKPNFLSYLSGYNNLSLIANIRNDVSKLDIESIMCQVGLDPNSKKNVKKYSLGMKQRLAIAQALMENPDLLILDEPFNGLDEAGVNLVRGILMEKKKEGKTILLTSHNSDDIELLCDRVVRIDRGEIVEEKYFNEKIN